MIGHNGGPRDSSDGWFVLHRSMIDHPVVGFGQPVKPENPRRGSYSRAEAWIWLIQAAAYCEHVFQGNDYSVNLKPGQLVGGRKHLANIWNWSEKTVRGFLGKLQAELMITLATDEIRAKRRANTPQVVTLCNYLQYQLRELVEGPTEGPTKGQQRANEGPTEGQIINKGKESINKSPPIVPQRGTSEHPMPSNVKPLTSETLYGEAHQPESVWLDDHGRPQIANGFRMEWVKRYQEKGLTEDILDLDVISLNVQPNSRLPLRNKMDRHLSLQLRKTAAKPKTEYDQKCDEMAEAMRKLLAD